MPQPRFELIATFPLVYAGDCSLLGVGPDGVIYVEELYGDGWMAQHAVRADGTIRATVDERGGNADTLEPLPLPDDLIQPRAGWHSMKLNYSGPRLRGLREPERTLDLVKPLSLAEKMLLHDRYALDMPPLLLGLAESYVLAEAPLDGAGLFAVCRRVRIAAALPQPQTDADGAAYDYDTRVLYLAHLFDRDALDAPTLFDADTSLISDALCRPMDCLTIGDRLYVADGGDGERLSAVRVFQIHDLPARPTSDEILLKKLYG